jgi:effector-binding domain-containing protein
MQPCEIVELEPQPAAVVQAEVPMAELPAFFGRAFGAVMEAVARQGLSVVGPPFGYYPKMPGDLVAVAAGFPVSAEVTPEGEVTSLVLPGGRALTVEHVGPYDTLEQTYGELATWVEKNGLATDDVMWESYLTDPDTEPPENWRTLITWPLR